MSLVIQIPTASNFRQPIARFTAVFNAVTPGVYDWNSAGNTNVPLLRLRKNHLYLIDRYSFWADIEEESFTLAVNGGTTPTLQLTLPSQTNRQIYPEPIPLGNFVDGLETLIAVFTEQEDILSGTFRGVLTQPFPLVGILSISCSFQPNIYEIKNREWIDNFLGTTKGGQTPGMLGLPGRRKG